MSTFVSTQESQGEKRIYVGNLPDEATESLLYTVFLTFGEIKAVEIPLDNSQKSKGFGFVDYEEAADAQEAIFNMDDTEWLGKIIKVQSSRTNNRVSQTVAANRPIWDDKEYQKKYMNLNEDGEAPATGGEAPEDNTSTSPQQKVENEISKEITSQNLQPSDV